MDSAVARERALDAAEELFYGRGIQSVGMDDIRGASGVSLKRLYQLFPAKEQLVEAYLERRDGRWRGRLAEFVELRSTPGNGSSRSSTGWRSGSARRASAGARGSTRTASWARPRTGWRPRSGRTRGRSGTTSPHWWPPRGGPRRWPGRSSCSPREPW